MKRMRCAIVAFVVGAVNLQFGARSQAGLFKVDFGHMENEREIVNAEGEATGEFPEVLTDWNVIPTWTFDDPAVNVAPDSASIVGVANADGTEVTWKLKDFSTSGDNDVTMTLLDNKALAESLNAEAPPYMLGQTANNPTKEGLTAVYDGIVVPAVVKDDYLYRNPDAAGSEVLMRFANLNPGNYHVTLFEGRTTDANGRYGKVWVDDITGGKEPVEQNTGNYSGVNANGVAVPLGQPRTVTVTVKAGEYLWVADMEDNSGGISGMIIRGKPAEVVSASVVVLASATLGGTYALAADATVDVPNKSIKVATTGAARFFRLQGTAKITSTSLSSGVLEIKYQ